MRNGFVKTITDSYHESQCPYCKHNNIKKSKTTYGIDTVRCEVCGNWYKIFIDRESIFEGIKPSKSGGGDVERRVH
jgi:transcription elongation factor Elf1